MALSEYEKQVLAQMEAQLKEADPSLASVMTSSMKEEVKEPVSSVYSPRRIALGSIISITGLAVVLGGVSFGFGWVAILLGVLGFLMMVGGILWAIKTDPGEGRKAPSSKRKGSRPSGNFMDRQRSRWDDRGGQR